MSEGRHPQHPVQGNDPGRSAAPNQDLDGLKLRVAATAGASNERIDDLEAELDERVRRIDVRLSAQLNEILHHHKFQSLEGSWRGLRYLVDHTMTGPPLQIRVLSLTKDELRDDLTAGKAEASVEKSDLFRKVCGGESDDLGHIPFGVLLGDYAFGPSAQDVKLLARVSRLAAAAYAPFLAGVDPSMFKVESFAELDAVEEVGSIFEGIEYAEWNAFRDTDESRFVALTLPRILIREPYGRDAIPVREFDFEEDVERENHEKYVWSNATWALGASVARAFITYGWCARILGVESGGFVEGLPVVGYETAAGDHASVGPTDAALAPRMGSNLEYQLSRLGFVPLARGPGRASAVFFSVNSAQKPKEYTDEASSAIAVRSAQLPFLLPVCRFAHCLRAMIHGWLGSYMTKAMLADKLNAWISGYVLQDHEASEDRQAMRPLSHGRVEVLEHPREPGRYQVVALVGPRFQLDTMDFRMRVVIDLPGG